MAGGRADTPVATPSRIVDGRAASDRQSRRSRRTEAHPATPVREEPTNRGAPSDTSQGSANGQRRTQ